MSPGKIVLVCRLQSDGRKQENVALLSNSTTDTIMIH